MPDTQYQFVNGINCALFLDSGGGIILKFQLLQYSDILGFNSDLVFKLHKAICRSIQELGYHDPRDAGSNQEYQLAVESIPTLTENEISNSNEIVMVKTWEWIAAQDGVAVSFMLHPHGEKNYLIPCPALFVLFDFIEWIINNEQLIDLNEFRRKSLRDMEGEILSSAGYEIFNILEALNASRRVLDANFFELEHHILKCHGEIKDPNYYVWQRRYSVTLFLEETIRLLHNYVSSCKMFVAHTRRYRKGLFKNSEPGIIQSEIDQRFKNSGLVQFIHEFRNFLLHSSLPPLSLQHTFSDSEITGLLYIPAKLLLKDKKQWNSSALNFIRDQDGKINLLENIRNYQINVDSFHDWLREYVECSFSRELRSTELKRRLYMSRHYRQAMEDFEQELKRIPRSDPVSMNRLLNLFSELLSKEEFHELSEYENDKREWLRQAASFIQKKFPISKNILQDIESLRVD